MPVDTARSRDALTTDALNSLVHQFSDALCFYRELIQNSLDALSRAIQIDLTWSDGLTTIAVSDQGEGMTRDIIETELTRLFSSSKENDLTKIGKFGVGFVSVFALDPHAVVVDTSREGENWRVIFQPDRSYTLVRMPQPVGGTVVRLIKPMTHPEFDDLERRSEDIISYWCKYSEATITYQGRVLNQPFDVEGSVKIQLDKGSNTQVVAGLTTDVNPFYGLYNRGLTLVEGRQQFFPHVTFRLKSYWLEHTISRDNVMQDENYRKALAIVKEAVYGHLYPQLLTRLASGEDALLAYIPGLLRSPGLCPPGLLESPIFRTLAGPRVSPQDLRRARKKHGAVYYASPPDAVADALLAKRVPVLASGNLEVLEMAVRAVVGEAPVEAGQARFLPVLVPAGPADVRRVLKQAQALMHRAGHPIRQVLLADFNYPGSCLGGEIAVLCPFLKRPNQAPPLRPPWPAGMPRSYLLVNRQHPLVQDVLVAASRDSATAAHSLVYMLELVGALPPVPPETALKQSLRQR